MLSKAAAVFLGAFLKGLPVLLRLVSCIGTSQQVLLFLTPEHRHILPLGKRLQIGTPGKTTAHQPLQSKGEDGNTKITLNNSWGAGECKRIFGSAITKQGWVKAYQGDWGPRATSCMHASTSPRPPPIRCSSKKGARLVFLHDRTAALGMVTSTAPSSMS